MSATDQTSPKFAIGLSSQRQDSARPSPAPVDIYPRRIRVMLADDHDIVRDGLARLLQMQPDFDVIGQAADGLQAINLAHQVRPDVIVMDVSMPNLDGVEATRRIVADFPAVRVIGLSMHGHEEVAAAMTAAGAVAYLPKTSQPETLIDTIRTNGHATTRPTP